jgi:hypothetical protein
MKSGKNPQANDPTVKIRKPYRNTFLNPTPSETFPKIRTHPAITSR